MNSNKIEQKQEHLNESYLILEHMATADTEKICNHSNSGHAD